MSNVRDVIEKALGWKERTITEDADAVLTALRDAGYVVGEGVTDTLDDISEHADIAMVATIRGAMERASPENPNPEYDAIQAVIDILPNLGLALIRVEGSGD